MRALLFGAALAGAGLAYQQRRQRDQYPKQPWRRHLGHGGRPRRAAESVPLLRWAQAASLLSFCSAAARDGPAAPAQPPQFALMRIAGDGRCLFRALSIGAHLLENQGELGSLSFDEHTHMADDLRQRVCDELCARRADLEPFLDEGFDSYVARMRQPRTWGGEPELAVAPHVLKRPVSVYSADQGGLALVSQYGLDDYPGTADVSLLFHGAGHYDLLVKQEEPGAAPQARL